MERRHPGKLPEFEGYVVDERLREFRKVTWEKGETSIEFVPFLSEKGAGLLKKMMREQVRLRSPVSHSY